MSTIRHEWRLVGASMLIYLLIIGTTYSSFGLFVVPVSAEFELSRANMNTTLILLSFGNAALSPLVGMALDRFPLKRIMVGSAILFGLSLAALGLSGSVLTSAFVVAVPLAIAICGTGTITVSVLLARRFVAHRGRAMALAAVGQSLGGIVVAPVVGLLIDSHGWRSALLFVAGAVTLLLLLVSLAVREGPAADGAHHARPTTAADADRRDPQPNNVPTIASLLRTAQFWSIGLGASIAIGVSLALSITMVPLALEFGLSMVQAASLVSVVGGAAITGKLMLAVVADRVDRVLLLTALVAFGIIPNAALLLSDSYALLLIAAAFVGITTGALAPIFFALLADRFGTAAFGTVRGTMAPVTAIMGAITVRFAGEVFDRTGGYALAFAVFIAAEIIAAILIFSTRFAPPVAIRPVPAPEPVGA